MHCDISCLRFLAVCRWRFGFGLDHIPVIDPLFSRVYEWDLGKLPIVASDPDDGNL